LIGRYEADYRKAIETIDNGQVKNLVETGRDMAAIMLFAEQVSIISNIYEQLKMLYSTIYDHQCVLRRFGSKRIEQFGNLPLLLSPICDIADSDEDTEVGQFMRDHRSLIPIYDIAMRHPDEIGLSVKYSQEQIEARTKFLLKEAGFQKTHWYINERVLTEIEYMLDTMRILIEPDFLPVSALGEGSQNVEDGTDRYIPASVRTSVWRRDNAKCVECGAKEKLEYDHIIPLSKGGANTERNIQLLCEKCNRKKGSNI